MDCVHGIKEEIGILALFDKIYRFHHFTIETIFVTIEYG
jgi:hypothetical protein